MKNQSIIFEDTTLRDGEQSPGIAFTKEEKLKITDLLIEAGIKWIEAGIPAMGGDELEALKGILERKDEATFLAWNRGVKEDVKFSIDLGFKAVHIGLPTSEIHLKDSLNKNRDWLLNQATDLVKYAKDRDVYVSISAEDVGRTDVPFLQEYAVKVTEAGADRLRLSDTIGILTPQTYAQKIAKVRDVSKIALQCHAHNDFGLAVANTIAGLEAGATYFHATVNGIGERAGMADIAQVVLALKHLYQVDLGVHCEKLKQLSQYVAVATGYAPVPWTPIIGENVFAHESGIHAKGMLNNSKAFEPISPEEVGAKRKYILGKHSGRAIINHYLCEENIFANDNELQKCLELVRRQAVKQKSSVSMEQLKVIYHQVKNELS